MPSKKEKDQKSIGKPNLGVLPVNRADVGTPNITKTIDKEERQFRCQTGKQAKPLHTKCDHS